MTIKIANQQPAADAPGAMHTAAKPTGLAPLPTDDRLIAAADLPSFIGLKSQTLARLRHEGKGPAFRRIGRRIFYRASDVRSWVEANAHNSTIYYKER
jgi:predicted DNA-binding transcriptional regulator AlpA